jgi:hypothetical protein
LYYADVDRADFEKACALYKIWRISGENFFKNNINFIDSLMNIYRKQTFKR